jgi:opacity protein-like surface antigen
MRNLFNTNPERKPNFNLMKRNLLILAMVAGLGLTAFAQGLRLNGYAAYVFQDRIDSYYDATGNYTGQINDGFQWGIGLEFLARPTKGIELKYIRRDAVAPLKYPGSFGYNDYDLGINYILLGGNNYFKTGGKIEPYAGAGLGVAILSVKNTDITKTKFAWDVKLGTNIWVTPKVALKLQAELLSAVQSVGGGFYFGSGGSGAGVSTYSTMYQWALGGGLALKVGK